MSYNTSEKLYKMAANAFETKNAYSFMNSATEPPIVLMPKKPLTTYCSDGILALVAPVVAYWSMSLLFHTIDTLRLAEKYRIHPSEEVASKNKASRTEVLKEVLFQHLIQSVTGLTMLYFDPEPTTGFEMNEMWHWRRSVPLWIPNEAIYFAYSYGFSFAKIFFGFFLVDTWQYWLHRLMHTNKTLYKNFHSRHHRLYVPYAYGALYNSPTEGFLLDTCGTGLAAILMHLTHTEQVFLYTFATMKTVDDHCGYALPWDPFQWLFPNNAVYHDIHHQQFGIKTNFAQPFFTIWDTVFCTKYDGFKEYERQQRRVTIDRYKDFLAKREQEKLAKMKDLGIGNKKQN